MALWSEAGHKIHATGYHAETDQNVTWYICNCKLFWFDRVPRAELDDAESILDKKCGPNQSGWVWSKKWQKGFNVVPTDWFEHQVKEELNFCPKGCLKLW
ncbi:hypothetical protein HD806DRAFT_536130 [Xylariaceae sp. AK1471]|nr:hypothetical protein HD806DRAFT_536130 [Xylariaceae sp. AK1471]